MAPRTEVQVSIPCHIKPYVRFSLIRLSDNLPPRAFKADVRIFPVERSARCASPPSRPATEYRVGICDHTMHGTVGSCSSWPPGIACAGVVVISLSGVVGRLRHAPSLTSSLGSVEAEALPSHRVVLSRWSPVLWPPPTSHAAFPRISLALIPKITVDVATDRMRSPLFHRPLSQHSAPPTPESSSRLRFQNLHLFRGLHHLSNGSALSGPFRAR